MPGLGQYTRRGGYDRMRRTMSLFLALVLLLAMVAPAIVSGSAKPIMVYSSVDEENAKKILDAFQKDTGIPYRLLHLSSGPALARIEAEQANPKADVWMGAPSENHVLAKERGLTQPYVSPNAAALDKKLKDPQGFWTCFYMNPLGIAVRTDFLQRNRIAAPTSWADLLKPEFKGQIQMPSPQTSGTAYNMVAALVLLWGEDRAFDYMKKLHPNIQTYTQSGTAPSQAVAIGQANVAIQFTPAFLQLIDQGYPLQLIFPSEGVGYEAPAVSILKGAPNVEGAQALVDWLISLKGQNVIAQSKTYFFPVHPQSTAAQGLPSFSDIKTVDYDAIWAGKERSRLVEKWINEVLRAPR